MLAVGKPRAPSRASCMGAGGLGLTLDQEYIGHSYADHWLLQSEPGLSDGEGSSGSTQSLKDWIYFTAKRKQRKSSLSAELSGSLGGKVQSGWGKRTQGCHVAFRLVWYRNPL